MSAGRTSVGGYFSRQCSSFFIDYIEIVLAHQDVDVMIFRVNDQKDATTMKLLF